MTEPSPNDIMTAYAANAVNFAQSNFGVSLDFTVESMEQVEALANRLFHTRPKGFVAKLFRKQPSDNDVQDVCKMLGSYIGEVYRQNKGGEWQINHDLQAIGLLDGETWIFPLAKVLKRITNGKKDDLKAYFAEIAE
ncbi:MAG: hypothetical protein M0R33_17855 [Methylomonas sp.]|jgi:hypothetical protein|uniref:hypothetical protein n=1 Tax=Methylomonas sp. TaxID=418 RepID=UPI0025CCD6C1|nr:hypothetical protein [Methylomonas sp.]MCK9608313.1 hypothetical protein [Methylomonas sp.]